MYNYEKIQNDVRQFIKIKGISRSKFSKTAEIHPTTMTRFLNGGQKPSSTALERMIVTMDRHVKDYFDESEVQENYLIKFNFEEVTVEEIDTIIHELKRIEVVKMNRQSSELYEQQLRNEWQLDKRL